MKSFILGAGALMVVGCGGPDHQALCEEAEKCIGGNDADIQACVIRLDAIADLVASEGCGDEYDEYFACFEEKAECDDEDFELKGNDPCEAESNALNRCSEIGLDID
jgi:hypothetical protein